MFSSILHSNRNLGAHEVGFVTLDHFNSHKLQMVRLIIIFFTPLTWLRFLKIVNQQLHLEPPNTTFEIFMTF